jgi:hypothetical protein
MSGKSGYRRAIQIDLEAARCGVALESDPADPVVVGV